MSVFFDSHVHWHFPNYDEDRAQAIERARRAGVGYFMNVGTDLETSRQSLALAEEHDFIWASAGFHPHDAKDADDAALKEIEAVLEHPRVAAIGEVGLDYFRNHSPRETQLDVLKKFINLHFKIGKPLIIHCRDAYQDLVKLFREVQQKPYRGIIHCFSSHTEDMNQFIELGFHISFAGPLTYKKNDVLREACRACPKDRLILETDAPFLPPQTHRGQRNESAYLLETAQVAADLHNLQLEELAALTQSNTRTALAL